MKESIYSPGNARTETSSGRRWLIGAVAAVAALGGIGLAWRTYRATGTLMAVQPSFWQREFTTPGGQTLRMEFFRGKPLLLNFWATWCPPCIEELPLLSSFYNKNLINGWQVLGLAIDEPDSVRRFLARTPVTFPMLLAGASGLEISRYLGNSVGGLPFTVVLNSSGEIVQRKMGRVSPAELNEWITIKQPQMQL